MAVAARNLAPFVIRYRYRPHRSSSSATTCTHARTGSIVLALAQRFVVLGSRSTSRALTALPCRMASTSSDPTAAAAALEHGQQHEHAPQRQWPQRSRAEKLAYRHAKRDAARRAFAREVGDDEQGRAAQTSVSLARDAGLRLVAPYWFTHHSFVKGVWVGRSVATLQRAYCLGLMADEGAAERDGAPDEAVLRRWLELGRLRVNGSCAHPDGAHASFADLLLRSGDKLAHTVHLHEPPVRLWDPARPSPELLRVLREQEALGVRDDDAIVRAAVPTTRVGAVVVADKPSSLPVHPAGKYRHNSLTLLLQRHCAYGTLHRAYLLAGEARCRH